jgi:hypothetical protein
MEINGEIAIDLGELRRVAEQWLAGADELAAELERLSAQAEDATLGVGVTEAFTQLVRAWTSAGAGLASDLAVHASALAASESDYAAADARAAHHQTVALVRPVGRP